nr:MAG TPA: hypothetical protein [Caudoviricetes sp.]
MRLLACTISLCYNDLRGILQKLPPRLGLSFWLRLLTLIGR